MLKATKNGKLWMVTQPDHAEVAGYLAAHWGNDDFARPGHYAAAPDAERLRAEVIFAVAQHDNGWWEWEATPDVSADDGSPLDLSEVLKDQQAGMNRWRTGLRRFEQSPLHNLLNSMHANWLYAIRVLPNPDPAFAHPLFWKGSPARLYPGGLEPARVFMAELERMQAGWKSVLGADAATAPWIEPQHLQPHARLLQLCDGSSLALASNLIPAVEPPSKGLGDDAFELHDVPRQNWSDLVTIRVTPHATDGWNWIPIPSMWIRFRWCFRRERCSCPRIGRRTCSPGGTVPCRRRCTSRCATRRRSPVVAWLESAPSPRVASGPVLVRRRDGGELQGHRVADGDQHGRIIRVHGAQPLARCRVGLRHLDDQTRHLDGQLAAFFGRLGDQRVAWNKLHRGCAGIGHGAALSTRVCGVPRMRRSLDERARETLPRVASPGFAAFVRSGNRRKFRIILRNP